MPTRDQVEEAIEPLLFALEDAMDVQQRMRMPQRFLNRESLPDCWKWFSQLSSLEAKRQALQITRSGFLKDVLQLFALEHPGLKYLAFTPISKQDLQVLQNLGDMDARFTGRPYFTLQLSRMCCECLGIEFGLQWEIDCLEAGRSLFSGLVRLPNFDLLGVEAALSSSLLLLSPFELEEVLFKASFGAFFTGEAIATSFTLGEFICRELRFALDKSFVMRQDAIVPHAIVSFWETCGVEVQRRIQVNAARLMLSLPRRDKRKTFEPTAEAAECNALFFPLHGEEVLTLLSEQLVVAWKESVKSSFLLELDQEAAAVAAQQAKSKKRKQDPVSKKAKAPPAPVEKLQQPQKQPVEVPPPLPEQHQAIEVAKIELMDLPQAVTASEKEAIVKVAKVQPPPQPVAANEKETTFLSSSSPGVAAMPPQPAVDLSLILSTMNLLVDEVSKLIKLQEETQRTVIELTQALSQLFAAKPDPVPPTPPASVPATSQPPSPPAVPAATAAVPPTKPTHPPHPFFAHHNNATHHFRAPHQPLYLPHYPSPPQPVFVRPHEWHGTETIVFHHQHSPNQLPFTPHHHQHQSSEQAMRHLAVPQLFEHGLLPVDSVVAANLTKGILSFAEHCRVSRSRREPSEQAVLGLMRNLVGSLWPRAQVKAFGSSQTGLALPDSDMDLVVCLPKVRIEDPDERASWQKKLAAALTQCSWVDSESLKRIQHVPMPIITLDTTHSVRLDVSFQSDMHFGVETNKLIGSLQHELKMLRPLVLVLKQFLLDRGLGKGFSGGLSSYSLVIMCTCFLHASSRLVAPTSHHQHPNQHSDLDDVGVLLVCFLRFFGEQFDPRATGISISRGFFQRHAVLPASSSSIPATQTPAATVTTPTMPVRRRSFRIEDLDGNPPTAMTDHHHHHNVTAPDPLTPHKFDPLLIEDPLQPGNNVGRNVFRIHQIQRACADAAKALKTPGAWPLGSIVSSWRPQFSSLPTFRNLVGSNSNGSASGSSADGNSNTGEVKSTRAKSMDLSH